MASDTVPSEADILAEIVMADQPGYPRELAEAILRLKFTNHAVKRMHDLAEKNRRDELTHLERSLLDNYRRVGGFLNLLQAKARLSLQDAHE
jgi:hypothetical protein